MTSKYILITCYECEIDLTVHDSYEGVKDELMGLSFGDKEIDDILTGDTYNDWRDGGYVKFQRIEL